jgi:hypothetical protein
MRPKDEECPTNEFSEGTPSGKCWGDGHYGCKLCKFFRKDFLDNPNKKHNLLYGQGGIQITVLS